MSDEYDNESNISCSTFWPLLVLVGGLLLWIGYQDFAQNSQRLVYDQQFQAALPTINAAENIQKRYVDLMKDLVETSAKDTYAAQIVKEATQAGLIRINPASGTNSAATPSAPTPPQK